MIFNGLGLFLEGFGLFLNGVGWFGIVSNGLFLNGLGWYWIVFYCFGWCWHRLTTTFTTTHNHSQPFTTIHNHSQPFKTIHNHSHNHSQPRKTSQNHAKQPKRNSNAVWQVKKGSIVAFMTMAQRATMAIGGKVHSIVIKPVALQRTAASNLRAALDATLPELSTTSIKCQILPFVGLLIMLLGMDSAAGNVRFFAELVEEYKHFPKVLLMAGFCFGHQVGYKSFHGRFTIPFQFFGIAVWIDKPWVSHCMDYLRMIHGESMDKVLALRCRRRPPTTGQQALRRPPAPRCPSWRQRRGACTR